MARERENCLEEIAISGLTHVNSIGGIQMVDVSEKPATVREAVARGIVLLTPGHLEALGSLPKGDAIVTAQIAGIQGGKRTADLIPLCHTVPLSKLDVSITPIEGALEIIATAKTTGGTGVEMEAYTAVVTAGITLIDMLKGIDPDLTLTDVQLLSKTGGKAPWNRNSCETK
jgi:cyclic pyranopterin phosphate synthase